MTERTTICLHIIHTIHHYHDIMVPPTFEAHSNNQEYSPPPPSSYTTRGIRSYRRRLLLQQRLLRQLIRLLGTDYIISATIENYPDQPQILTLRQLLERSWIFEGDLRSVVSSRRNHLYVGGLTLLSSPLPRIDDIYIAVSDAVHDSTPLQYY
jgi:hypothetical protein